MSPHNKRMGSLLGSLCLMWTATTVMHGTVVQGQTNPTCTATETAVGGTGIGSFRACVGNKRTRWHNPLDDRNYAITASCGQLSGCIAAGPFWGLPPGWREQWVEGTSSCRKYNRLAVALWSARPDLAQYADGVLRAGAYTAYELREWDQDVSASHVVVCVSSNLRLVCSDCRSSLASCQCGSAYRATAEYFMRRTAPGDLFQGCASQRCCEAITAAGPDFGALTVRHTKCAGGQCTTSTVTMRMNPMGAAHDSTVEPYDQTNWALGTLCTPCATETC